MIEQENNKSKWKTMNSHLQIFKKISILFCSWPVDNTSYKKFIIENIVWNVFFVNFIVYAIPNSLSIYHMSKNTPLSLYFQWISNIDAIFIMTISRFQRSRLLVLILL